MSTYPSLDQSKLETLKSKLETLTELSSIIIAIQNQKYEKLKKNVDIYDRGIENYINMTPKDKADIDIRDVFFNETFPLFLRNMNMFIQFNDDYIL